MSLPVPAHEPSSSKVPDIVDRPVLRASGPAEIVQLVPYLLGFHPAQSLVMLAMRGRRIVVSVRYDLEAPFEMLLPWFGSATKAGATHVVALVYTDDVNGPPLPLRGYVDRLGAHFEECRLEEVDALLISEGRWWSYRCRNPRCCPPEGTEVQPTGAIAASAVSEGMVALPSREALESELSIDELGMNVVKAEIGKLLCSWLDEPAASDAVYRAQDWKAVRSFVRKAKRGAPFKPAEAAAVLCALRDRSVRDAAIGYLVDRPDPEVCEAWRRLTRVAPPEWRAPPATLYAMWCYASGSGARTNMGIDVALAAEPDYTMAQILLELQSTGLNPFEFIYDMAQEAQLVGRRIQRRRRPSGRQQAEP